VDSGTARHAHRCVAAFANGHFGIEVATDSLTPDRVADRIEAICT
jgi:hypothetical protein